MQYILVVLQCEEASSYSILIKCNFCNFAIECPQPWMPMTVAPFAPLLRAIATGQDICDSLIDVLHKHNVQVD